MHKRLDRFLQPTPMPLGDVLYESGEQLTDVCFPTTSIVSMVYVVEDGRSAEIALVGNEAILGVALFMGGKLQAAGLIEYNRGRITVLDRKRLEAQACECYGVVKTEYDRLLAAAAP